MKEKPDLSAPREASCVLPAWTVDPTAISVQVRTQIRAVDPELPVFHQETLDDVLSSSLSVRRFSMEMVALFAATALLLAGLGIYGTIAFLVNEQSRPIGTRDLLDSSREADFPGRILATSCKMAVFVLFTRM